MERTHRRATWPPCSESRSGFNPCCDGTDSSTARVCCSELRGIGVSILVVMERTHRHRQAGRATIDEDDVSILVVMERTHRPADIPKIPIPSDSFQSLL